MELSMTSIDDKAKAYLVQVIALGLQTDVSEDLLDDYCSGLVRIISDQPFDAYASGDRDGILVLDGNDNLFMNLIIKPNLVQFRVMSEYQTPDLDPEIAEVILRVVLTTIGWTLEFLPSASILPNTGLTAGHKKETSFSFKDDGFGIT